MLLLLLNLIDQTSTASQDEMIRRVVQLSDISTKDIAAHLGMSSENFQASLSNRRPMVNGERLIKLRALLGIRDDGSLDNHHVHFWRTKPKNLDTFKKMTVSMFPRGAHQRELLFSDSGSLVTTCIYSPDFVLVLKPTTALDLSFLNLERETPKRVPVTALEFLALPADRALKSLEPGVLEWPEVIEHLKVLNISAAEALEWGKSYAKGRRHSDNEV